jgi:hypothetical protein
VQAQHLTTEKVHKKEKKHELMRAENSQKALLKRCPPIKYLMSYILTVLEETDKKDLVSSELPVPLILHQGTLTRKGKLFAVFRIRIEFNADLDPDPTFKHLAERKLNEDNKK